MKTIKTAALIAAAFTVGAILTSWSNASDAKVNQLKKAYQIEKARADAARILINEVRRDWHEFYDSTGSGDAFGDWLDAEAMKY